MIEHISLDFWNTIGSPNYIYAQKRTELLAKNFGVTEKSAKETYTEVKKILDHETECNHQEAYNRLIEAFIDENTDKNGLYTLIFEIPKLFSHNPPPVPPVLLNALKMAYFRGITLSIGSNTNFINGETIKKAVLEPRLVANYLSFCVFSDELGYRKPSPHFFKSIIGLTRKNNLRIDDPSQILHIGDDIRCDGPSTDFGMQFAHTKNPEHTAQIIMELLEKQ